jgi:hypothetical protein
VVRENPLPHGSRQLKKHLMSLVAALPNQPPKQPNQTEGIR